MRCLQRTAAALLLLVAVAGCAGPARPPANAAIGETAAASPQRPQVPVPGPSGEEEGRADLPDFPRDADLVEIRQGVRPELRFFVDARSVQVPGGDEVRYTFVVSNASGGRNITFEAMRCFARTRVTLAVGSANGTWTAARFARWEPVDVNDTAGQRGTLHQDMFCPSRAAVANVKEAVQALRSGMHPRAGAATSR